MLQSNSPMLKQPQTSKYLPAKITGLSYSSGDKQLLHDLNFTLSEQGCTVIMGPNGAGKSLTLRLLHGLIRLKSGSIIWGEKEHSKEVWRRQAMVFQKPVMLRRTVRDNFAYALKITKTKPKAEHPGLIEKALTVANLTALAGNPARRLSGGEQQRLAIARALMLEPEMIFLDEPTASLDPASTLSIELLIKEATGNGIKVVLVSHDIGQTKRLADDIIFLHNGKVQEQGPASDFLQGPQSEAARQYLAGQIVTID